MVKRDSKSKQAPPGKAEERAAAARLLKLRREGETDAELARRVGLSSQHIQNYKAGKGLGLTVCAQLTLPSHELMYVLRGTNDLPREDYIAGMREAFAVNESVAAVERTLKDLEARLAGELPTTCREPTTDGDRPDQGGKTLPPPEEVDTSGR